LFKRHKRFEQKGEVRCVFLLSQWSVCDFAYFGEDIPLDDLDGQIFDELSGKTPTVQSLTQRARRIPYRQFDPESTFMCIHHNFLHLFPFKEMLPKRSPARPVTPCRQLPSLLP